MFVTNDATGKPQAAWRAKEQLRTLLGTGSFAGAAASKDRMQALVEQSAQPETSRLWRTLLPVMESDRSPHRHRSDNSEGRGRQHRDQIGRGLTDADDYKNTCPIAQCRENSSVNTHRGRTFTMNRQQPI
ncbi:hypothetical protein N9A08_03690 [Arthrobacter koreensis]|uniref:Uncharacterized protein n=1 Tax=Arthrobacter koreensis TaxID=199136 RepID=A0ABY6FU87_9MICC|nr:hypothetical protein [Arthrobacter koreensis]UYB36788.1 hypothetical protein N9A08_03690 [Arthrobacter koreensis]